MLIEAAIIAGVKAVAAHGGLAAWLASSAASTAGSAGLAAAATQTAATVAGIGVVATVADGSVQAAEGMVEGRPLKAVCGVARAVSGADGVTR